MLTAHSQLNGQGNCDTHTWDTHTAWVSKGENSVNCDGVDEFSVHCVK